MSVGARKSSFSPESRVQWSNTVGSVLSEGGARRCRPGFRPSSCSVPAVVMARDGPGPLVGVQACTLEGPGDT